MTWQESAFIKLARKGAIVMLPLEDGKFLMQEETEDAPWKGNKRPPGGGHEPEDDTPLDTICRELKEEFGVEPDKVREKLKFLGYEYRKQWHDTAIFELKDHGLKPGMYQASNSPDEKVKLVVCTLDDPKYTGPRPEKLLSEEANRIKSEMLKSAFFPKDYDPEHLRMACLKMEKQASWAMDLDGTLAKPIKGEFDPEVIGEPQPLAMRRIKRWLEEGKEVVIFTARAHDKRNIPPIRKWLKANGLPGNLRITNEKTPDIELIQDDKAEWVEPGTGRVRFSKQAGLFTVDECRAASERLRRLWERRDPEGLEDRNPFREEFQASQKSNSNAVQQKLRQIYEAPSEGLDKEAAAADTTGAQASAVRPVQTSAPLTPGAAIGGIPKTGPAAIQHALAKLDLNKLEQDAKTIVTLKKKSKRPEAVKILGYLEGFKRSGLKPADLVITKVPVIPPQFRPYSVVGDTFVPGDANELYRDLINIRDVHKQLEAKLGERGASHTRLQIYDATKALYGFGDPTSPKTRERGVSGFLQKVTGTSPKFGVFQRKLISKDQDFVGRGVIGVDPDLELDQVGIPDEMLWPIFSPYIQRRLVRGGMTPEQAIKSLQDRNEHASRALDMELKERPVIYSRAPAWHKFSTISGYAKRIPGSTVLINPLVTTGLNADFDGDTINVHVPSLPEAVDDAREKLMPSKMLWSIKDRTKTMPLPKHESLLGLYTAQNRPARMSHVFPDQASALAAIRQGKVRLSDEIKIAPVKA